MPGEIDTQQFDFRIHRADSATKMGRPHRHHEVEINYLESGEATYLIGGRLARVPAHRFCFFWGAMPHQLLQSSDDCSGLWYVTVPLTWVMAWELPPRLLERLLHGEMLCDSNDRPADAMRLREWHDAIHGPDRRTEKPALLELEARFRRFALDNPQSPPADRPRGAGATPARIEQLARFIVEHYHKPVTLADIAAAAGVHPNYAANLFRQHCGQTLLQCLTQHRIAHAQRLLATTDAKVIDIAADSGFGSMSRFHEAFVASCGVSPGRYRRRFTPLIADSVQ